MPLDGKHSLSYKDDPQKDRPKMIAAMKGFKNSEYPKTSFKEGEPRTSIDEFYTPHKGGVKK